MFVILSPAKTLNEDVRELVGNIAQPAFIDESQELVDILKKKSSKDLQKLMSISEKLGDLNHQRYQDFETPFSALNAKQAIFMFHGDVYEGLAVESLNDDALMRLQRDVRMLSGLYGLLKPLDLMQPYRLEMGTKLANEQGKDLYAFWGNKLATQLNKEAKEQGVDTLINLASNEYSKAVDKKTLELKWVDIVFKEQKPDAEPKVIALYAKKARGLMARYIAQHNVQSIDALKAFDSAGYCYQKSLSSPSELVFVRQLEK